MGISRNCVRGVGIQQSRELGVKGFQGTEKAPADLWVFH